MLNFLFVSSRGLHFKSSKIQVFMMGFILFCVAPLSKATDYASIINNSNWYVPEPYYLAYITNSSSGFSTDLLPVGDQTLWNNLSVTSSTIDLTSFSGLSTAQFSIGNGTTTPSTSSMSGQVSPNGAIAILFTPTEGGNPTLGLGQFQTVNGIDSMEMQMITGSSVLTTHWAYMLPYDPNTFTPPLPTTIPISNESPNYAWTPGSVWKIVSPELFGSSTPGKFVITEYNGGYFIGTGVGPEGNPITFTELGSITPEGRVLFATLTDGSSILNTSYGEISGTNTSATMSLADYNSTTALAKGTYTYLYQITPYPDNISAAHNPAAASAANSLWNMATTQLGLTGAMAPVLTSLDNLSAAAQSDAISQTLPVLVGASSMVTSQNQTAFNQVMKSRQALLSGLSSGEEFAGNRDVWGKAFGNWANQGDLNNVSGYSVDGGGLAFGFDKQLSTKSNLGISLAYAYGSVSSNSSVAPSSVDVNSYQLGLYGDYQLQPTWQVNYQLDGAYNTNFSKRNLSAFAGTTGVGANATGSYNSYAVHAGLGLQKYFSLNPNTRLTPEVRLDYTTVQTDSYTESGGGLLNLKVNSQSYNTLYTSASLRLDHALSNGLNISGNVGIAYNALDTNAQLTSAYQGGGPTFVTNGLDISPWLYNAGVGIGGMVSKNVELNVRYDIDFSSTSYTNQMVSARVKFLF
jgi:outer membrane autotransporter protein